MRFASCQVRDKQYKRGEKRRAKARHLHRRADEARTRGTEATCAGLKPDTYTGTQRAS